MLHGQMDGCDAEVLSDETAAAADKMQSDLKSKCPVLHSQATEVSSTSPDVQTGDFIKQLDVASSLATGGFESFKVDCSLPSLRLNTLLSPFKFIDQMRKQSEIKDFLDFQCDAGFCGSKTEILEKSKMTKPYFIPELEMACAGALAEKVKEVNPPEIECLTVPEMDLPEIQTIKEPTLAGIKEEPLPFIEEANFSRLEDLNLPGIEKIQESKTEVPMPQEIEKLRESINKNHNFQPKLILQSKSSGILVPKTFQLDELIAPLVEKTKAVTKIGIISSLVGNKLALAPNIRLSFGDKAMRETNMKGGQSKEIIQQEASRALRALIFRLNVLKNIQAAANYNSQKSRAYRFEKIKNSLTFSRVFRQNIFHLTSDNANSKKIIEENSLGCGEPMIRSPREYKKPIPVQYRPDASERLTCNGLNVSKDSVFSEVSESDDSEVEDRLCVTQSCRDFYSLHRSTADLKDILSSGRILFSQHVRVFCFNKLKEWKRQGEGQIEILEYQGSFYIVLHDRVTGELVIYMRVNEKWRIDYMTKTSYSCRWTNINYASCREGILERIACSFREPSHAAEFVARIRNSAIQSRFELCS
ncbi:uncharacterized protein LOC108114381 isoform X2 [Drosophila eugracilis]|uniref:uncharacterized protein LOC108114381 isoform X2 n=1 Tax=Drosophila eugracilis TaxID=29029 RepID=UPI0007E888B0|nr:uncharacterized protein LOC108114381 isoform X2 [Drosophila eugracilis]